MRAGGGVLALMILIINVIGCFCYRRHSHLKEPRKGLSPLDYLNLKFNSDSTKTRSFTLFFLVVFAWIQNLIIFADIFWNNAKIL